MTASVPSASSAPSEIPTLPSARERTIVEEEAGLGTARELPADRRPPSPASYRLCLLIVSLKVVLLCLRVWGLREIGLRIGA